MKFIGKHTEEIAQRIVDTFRNPEQLPEALAHVLIRRKDDIPCRKWSWQNQLLVSLGDTTDARGFRQWKQAGRNIKKGSKALWILVPCKKTVTQKDEVTGEETQRTFVYGFRSMAVFAIEDTEGEPLPDSDDHYDAWTKQLPLIEVAQSWGISVGSYTHTGNAPLGYYGFGGGNQSIMLGVENLSTWAHEMVHAADHRLQGATHDRAHQEIVAELGGAVLLECLGMSHDADLGGAYSYIQSYAEETKKDAVRACIEVLGRVCNCVKLILDTAESHPTETALAISASVA